MSDVLGNAETNGTPEEVVVETPSGDVVGELVGSVIPADNVNIHEADEPVHEDANASTEDIHWSANQLIAFIQKADTRIRSILNSLPASTKEQLVAQLEQLLADIEKGL